MPLLVKECHCMYLSWYIGEEGFSLACTLLVFCMQGNSFLWRSKHHHNTLVINLYLVWFMGISFHLCIFYCIFNMLSSRLEGFFMTGYISPWLDGWINTVLVTSGKICLLWVPKQEIFSPFMPLRRKADPVHFVSPMEAGAKVHHNILSYSLLDPHGPRLRHLAWHNGRMKRLHIVVPFAFNRLLELWPNGHTFKLLIH